MPSVSTFVSLLQVAACAEEAHARKTAIKSVVIVSRARGDFKLCVPITFESKDLSENVYNSKS